MRNNFKIPLLLACATFVLSANAWRCQRCPDLRDWPDDTKRCGNCHEPKPLPKPTYIPPGQTYNNTPARQKYAPPPSTYAPASTSYTTLNTTESRSYSSRINDVTYTPLQVGVMPPLGIPPGEEYLVGGMCAGLIVSSVENVYGIEVAGCAAAVKKDFCGLQIAGIVSHGGSYGQSCSYGIQVAGLVTGNGKIRGAQIAGFATNATDMRGVQFGTYNEATYRLGGMQIGGWNVAGTVSGIQLGVINYAERMSGMQIGAINIIKNSDVPFSPVLNMCF